MNEIKKGHLVIDGTIHARLKERAAKRHLKLNEMAESKLRELLVEDEGLQPALDPINHPTQPATA